MQLFSKFRRIAPIIAIIFLVVLSSCNGSKKYGCPNHLSANAFVLPDVVLGLVNNLVIK